MFVFACFFLFSRENDCMVKKSVTKNAEHLSLKINPGENYCLYSDIRFTLYSISSISERTQIELYQFNSKNDELPLSYSGFPNQTNIHHFSKYKYSLLRFTATGDEPDEVEISYVGLGENTCSYGIIATNEKSITFDTDKPKDGIPSPLLAYQERCIFLNGGVDSTTFSFSGEISGTDSIQTFSNQIIANSSQNIKLLELHKSDLPQIIKISTGSQSGSRSYSFSIESKTNLNPSFITTSEFSVRTSYTADGSKPLNKETIIIIFIVVSIVIMIVIISLIYWWLRVKKVDTFKTPTQRESTTEEPIPDEQLYLV